MKTNLNNLEDIDKAIKQIIKEFIKQKKNNSTLPLNLNIQFDNGEGYDSGFEDIDDFIIDNDNVYLTMYYPYNLNQLRFDVDDNKNILTIRNFDFSFYKEIWVGFKIIKSSITSNYKNNILELNFSIKNL